jgi:N-acetylglucosamine kinase-like BadF-type ATPase
MDAGGTKLAVRAEALDGTPVFDHAFAAEGWDASPVNSAAEWLISRLRRSIRSDDEVVALGVGAQGCDTAEHCAALESALAARGYPAVVVNDGALLVPAAGLASGIGVISGTGAIGVGSSASGDPLFAGGWGWVLGDEAGAGGIVRVATIAALTAADEGRKDDGLLSALLNAFEVPTSERLARSVNDEPTPEHWGPHAPAVFVAADAGSELAIGVVETAAEHLVTLVGRLVDRGAVGDTVVAAGSVIVNQPRLFDALSRRLALKHPELTAKILDDAPVAGGVVLARGLLVEAG